jgi:myo-inositol-1(or 4)-monophosphatase
MNLDEVLEFTEDIAIGAGQILLKGFRSDKTITSFKSRTNLVTYIDKKSEKFLFENIRKKFPDNTIIAEEGSRSYADGDLIWYVDPLDATNNYAHGIPFFCISIGIFSKEAGKIIIGLVYDPYHNEIFSAMTGSGSYLNKERIHTSETDDLGFSIVATGFPYEKDDMSLNNTNQFIRFIPITQGIRRIGSAALDLSYIACGRIDGYWEPMLHPWDMAAGSLIVEEAGGRVTKYNGDIFDPEYPEILASNGRIHDQMIKILMSIKP